MCTCYIINVRVVVPLYYIINHNINNLIKGKDNVFGFTSESKALASLNKSCFLNSSRCMTTTLVVFKKTYRKIGS